MKDEIKEILEDLKEHSHSKYVAPLELIDIECQLLLDYITNLQEENERLREENKHIFANVNDDQLLRSNAMNYAEAQDYKTRNEKAIEYIKKHGLYDEEIGRCADELNDDEVTDVLWLLQGKSDE